MAMRLMRALKKNNDDLVKLLKDGCKVRKVTMTQLFDEFNNGVTQKRDERWDDWMSSSYELWGKQNEEEQRRELHTRWTYLRDLLHREGIGTSNHRLLLSMGCVRKPEGEIQFSIGSPDRGLVGINRLVFDHGAYFSLPRQTVSGLLCFKKKDAFLIYNPITGERSPWIETDKPGGKIAFGFNPQSNEHKVICISDNKSGSCQVVDIFTVGKDTWRRIEAVPPISIGHEAPFYVGGCLYWRFRGPPTWGLVEAEPEQILRFDIATEKFRVIPIPDHIIDPWRHKWSQTVELTEVDGCIAVLDWLCELQVSLSTMHEDANGNIRWNKEIVDIPPQWNGKPELSIEALTGTNQIFLRYADSEFFFYYNRNTKESLRFPVSPDCREFCWERTIQL